MIARMILFPAMLIASCDHAGTKGTPSPIPSEDRLQSFIYKIKMPADDFGRILWQRSFPASHAQLVEDLTADPFIEIGDQDPDELTPSDAGMHGWDRGLAWNAFGGLGHPVSEVEGATVSWYSLEGRFEVTHTPEAIRTFERTFPELTRIEDPNGQMVDSTH